MDFNDRIIYGSVEGRRRCRSKWIFVFYILDYMCLFGCKKDTIPVIISVISTVVMLGIRVYKFGIGDISIVAWPIMEVLVTVGTLYLVYRAIVPDQKTRGTRKTTTYQRRLKKQNRSIIQTGRLLHMEMITKTIMMMIITTNYEKSQR